MAKPLPRSYAQALGNFANGTDTPRDFLERCIAELVTARKCVFFKPNSLLIGIFAHFDCCFWFLHA
jgi:hypothetical protein